MRDKTDRNGRTLRVGRVVFWVVFSSAGALAVMSALTAPRVYRAIGALQRMSGGKSEIGLEEMASVLASDEAWARLTERLNAPRQDDRFLSVRRIKGGGERALASVLRSRPESRMAAVEVVQEIDRVRVSYCSPDRYAAAAITALLLEEGIVEAVRRRSDLYVKEAEESVQRAEAKQREIDERSAHGDSGGLDALRAELSRLVSEARDKTMGPGLLPQSWHIEPPTLPKGEDYLVAPIVWRVVAGGVMASLAGWGARRLVCRRGNFGQPRDKQ